MKENKKKTDIQQDNNKQDKKSKININKKRVFIYIALLIIVVYIIYTIYLLIKQPTTFFTVENGKLYMEETDIGYIIRDETVVQGENYKNGMEQIKTEGEKVAKNEAIFRYYTQNEENLKQKISELDEKIQIAMQENTGLFNSDMKIFELQIDTKVEELSKITDTSKLAEYKKQINELVTKKAKIAGDLSPAGSYLKQLINERSKYESELNSGSEYKKAPKSGIVSYRVDGLEESLTTADFSTLSKEYLEKLDLKTGKIIATSDECGKVIDNFQCYIATISSSEDAKKAKAGDKVKVRLPNNKEISSEISYISQENDNDYLIVLKINEEIEELTNYRKISFDLVWWSDTGLKVPNQAIVEKDGLNYVVRNRAGYLNKILVKIQRKNENYSLVENYDVKDLRELGYTDNQIEKYKSITLYDEILIHPDLDKTE